MAESSTQRRGFAVNVCASCASAILVPMGGRHANVVGTVPDGARACRTEFALAHTLKKEPPRRTSKVWRSRKHFVGEEM